MTEDEKINKVIEKYEGFFQSTNSDVAKTKKGVWIFFEYDASHRYYNSFFQFRTVVELEQIIAGVLAEEMNILIETTAEEILHGVEEFDINEAAKGCYDVSIPELLKNMEVLNRELKKSAERLDVIFRLMPGVLSGLEGNTSKENIFVSGKNGIRRNRDYEG